MKKQYYILANTGAGQPCFDYNLERYDTREEAQGVADELERYQEGIYQAWVQEVGDEEV